ncbi:hypothetical protein SAMN04488120_10460 [Fontimonas thermophila]|uniref:Uncharacterized protein n=1 Tax=Fontimonas thermophila TaxID=1076937 RepID=A0A1I2IL20_9GAMM|nr:hypothetical protein [Fontimonas thermophila]SFF43029.1 hypothetical protein SAMN04488120_10460 [Fontimonas thermophila]
MMRRSILLCAGLFVSACGGISRHCEGEFDYQRAQTLPPPAEVPGLQVPESPSALRIPPEPQTVVPFARQVQDPDNPDKTRIECLDIPPRMRSEPAEPVTPAPKA